MVAEDELAKTIQTAHTSPLFSIFRRVEGDRVAIHCFLDQDPWVVAKNSLPCVGEGRSLLLDVLYCFQISPVVQFSE